MFPEDKHLETFLVPNKKEESKPALSPLEVIQFFIYVPITFTVAITLFESLLAFDPTIEIDSRGVISIPTSVPNDAPPEQPPEDEPSSQQLPDDVPSSNPSVSENPTATPGGPNNPGPISSDSPPGTPISGRWIRIPSSCNGFYAEGANFRVRPSLDVSAIRGAVLAGDSVFLTGETETDIDGNGITWYRALNELPLRRSADVENNAQHVLDANQEGWIAACFVDS